MRTSLALVVAVVGCGRIGYDPAIDAGDDVDALEVDTPDAGPVGTFMACGAPELLIDVGDTGGASASGGFYLDVAATTTGFVVGWQTGTGQTYTSGLAISFDASGPYLDNIQSASMIASKFGPMSLAALGDDVLLGIDDEPSGVVKLFALAETGYDRGGVQVIDLRRAVGHDFVTADPARGQFLVATSTGSGTDLFVRDRDGKPVSGPFPLFSAGSESVAVRPFGAGYAAITGNSGTCDLVLASAAYVADDASRQSIAMTCHHASLVPDHDGDGVVAGWNCDNDRVWTTGGTPATALPAEHAVYGDGSNVASSPRLTTTTAGVWYGFAVGADRLGRALLGDDSQVVTGGDGAVVYTDAGLKAHDVASHSDHAFLFWLRLDGPSSQLWAMRLCPP